MSLSQSFIVDFNNDCKEITFSNPNALGSNRIYPHSLEISDTSNQFPSGRENPFSLWSCFLLDFSKRLFEASYYFLLSQTTILDFTSVRVR